MVGMGLAFTCVIPKRQDFSSLAFVYPNTCVPSFYVLKSDWSNLFLCYIELKINREG